MIVSRGLFECDRTPALLAAWKGRRGRYNDALAVEALLTPEESVQGGPATIIAFASDDGESNFALGQEDERLVFRLRTHVTGGKGMQFDLGPAGRDPQKGGPAGARGPVHVIVSYSGAERKDRLKAFLDGEEVFSTGRVVGDFRNWKGGHLVFGADAAGGRDWRGRIEAVSLYARPVSAEEAREKHRLVVRRIEGRAPLERLVLRGRLLGRRPRPPSRRRSTGGRSSSTSTRSRRLSKGRALTRTSSSPTGGVLDASPLAEVTGRRAGETYRLVLERYEEHPELAHEMYSSDFAEPEDLALAMYYDVGR
jgi:hypothetical protein